MNRRQARVKNWASLRPPVKPGSGGKPIRFGKTKGLSPRLSETFTDGHVAIHSCTVKLPF